MFQIEYGRNNIALHDIADQFYLKLNPRKKNKSFRKEALRRKILKKYKYETDPLKRNFYRELAQNRFSILKEIVTGDPYVLKKIHAFFESKVSRGEIPSFYIIKDGMPTSTKFGEEILLLFGYKSIRGGAKFTWLVDELDVFICPYCGSTETFQLKDPNIILFDFDHFMPKVIAPYLSLSFYNLIPSCHNCNSLLKGSIMFNVDTHLHPYIYDFHSLCKFTTTSPISQNNPNSFNVKIEITTSEVKKSTLIQENIKVFKIESRYNHFKDVVLRLDKLKDGYNESKKQEMLSKGVFGTIFSDRIELLKYISDHIDVPFDENTARKTAKGKFKLDFAKEFLILDP